MFTTRHNNPEDVKPPPKGMMLLAMRAIAVLGGSANSFDIRDYLARLTGSEIPTAQISTMLSRLERSGMVSSTGAERDPSLRRGRPRKLYSLTPGGQQSLEAGLRFFTNSDIKGRNDVYNSEEQTAAQGC